MHDKFGTKILGLVPSSKMVSKTKCHFNEYTLFQENKLFTTLEIKFSKRKRRKSNFLYILHFGKKNKGKFLESEFSEFWEDK